jgi:integrase
MQGACHGTASESSMRLRVGEALALRRSSINLLRSELRVTESLADVNGRLIFGSTKTRQARTVVVPFAVQAELEHHLDSFTEPTAESLVFTSFRGGPIRLQNFRRRVWEPAVKRVGLPDGLRIHDLRHTAASLLVNAGVPMKSVQEHLGHSSITVTMDRYSHLDDDARRHVAGVLDGLISGVAETDSRSNADHRRTIRGPSADQTRFERQGG